ncbi:hypothetical protein SteCoe_33043 [Stentor coeruleus]|uniref:Uncharacterized protein n=1 Tax=Stentor coeruleus TaxID=5963 RepID=A0A1R2AXP5_9CILI|nr:hypothetical protein SteCoe_33043 [Stentor coeruleus]
MERFEKLKQILSKPKENKIEFLQDLIEVVIDDGEIDETQESFYKKGILYLTSWILLPQTSISALPEDFLKILSLLDTDTSSLLPLFYAKFEQKYENLSKIICNDTLVAIALTIPNYGEKFLHLLNSDDCISPLLWLLTYSPSHLKLASEYLPIAISKPYGINELIDSFSKGDNTYKLKNLLIKILKLTPKTNKNQYLLQVLPQMVLIITEYKCDLIVENILEHVLNHFIIRTPELFLKMYDKVEEKLKADQRVKLFRILMQFVPPHVVVLYEIAKRFRFFVEFYEFLAGGCLEIKGQVLAMLGQFFLYWQEASLMFVEYSENLTSTYKFTDLADGSITFEKQEAQLNPMDHLNHLSSMLEHFANCSGSSKILSSIFSCLLIHFSESSSFSITYLVNYMLENLEPIFLISLTSEVQHFLEKTLISEDDKMLGLSLQIISQSMQNNPDKSFLLRISSRLLQLSKHENQFISQISQEIDKKISLILMKTTEIIGENPQDIDKKILEDLESQEAYICGIGLYRLSLNLQSLSIMPWELLDRHIGKDPFVFGELALCYKKALSFKPLEGLAHIFKKFAEASLENKSKILEILFVWIRGQKHIENFHKILMGFLMGQVSPNNDDMVKDGALVIIGKIVKKLGPGFHLYINDVVCEAVACIKLSNSRIASGRDAYKSTASGILVLEKVVKYCYADHVDPYLPEIAGAIQIFRGLYKKNDSLSVLAGNLEYEIQKRKLEELDL